MKTKNKLDLTVIALSLIPFIGWSALVLSTFEVTHEGYLIRVIAFVVLFSIVVIATSWPNKVSSIIAFIASLLALIPLYLETLTPYGENTAKSFPFIAAAFVLYYLLLNLLKLKRLKKEELGV